MMLFKPAERVISTAITGNTRSLHISAINLWQNYENERHFQRGEEAFRRVKHGLTYDFRRASRRYKEVFFNH